MYFRQAGVAQLVEQLTCNQQVISPNLIAGSITLRNLITEYVVVWPSGQWQQTVNLPTEVYESSNLSPSTNVIAGVA